MRVAGWTHRVGGEVSPSLAVGRSELVSGLWLVGRAGIGGRRGSKCCGRRFLAVRKCSSDGAHPLFIDVSPNPRHASDGLM